MSTWVSVVVATTTPSQRSSPSSRSWHAVTPYSRASSPVSAWAVCEEKSVSFVGDAAKVFDSSMISERAFCGNCGTSLYTVVKRLGYYAIRLATLDNPEDYPPTVHFGVESQLPWLDIHDDLPRIRTEDDPGISQRWISAGEPGGGPILGTAEERLRATVKR